MNTYSTTYASMLNLLKILEQLDQYALPIICDKGVFRILVDVYLPMKDKFQILIQILGGFHATICVENCIEKCIKGSGTEGSL